MVVALRSQITSPFAARKRISEFLKRDIFVSHVRQGKKSRVRVQCGLLGNRNLPRKVSERPGFRDERLASEGDSTRETFHARESRAPCDFSRRVSRTRMRTGDARFAERA